MVIITIHNIFFKETTIIHNTYQNFLLPFCSYCFVEFFWRMVVKEVVYNGHQFDLKLEVPIAQFLF